MGLKLSFTINPPTPYHTVNFHLNRGIKQKWHNPAKSVDEITVLLSEVLENLKIITRLPDHFSVCILPSKVHFLSIINPCYTRNIFIYPAEYSNESFLLPEFCKRKLFDQTLSQYSVKDLRFVKKGTAIYGQETDFITGGILDFRSMLSIKKMNSEINLFLDISSSFVNYNFNYENVDGFVFSTDHVIGLFPGVTIFAIRNTLLEILLRHWRLLFITDQHKKFKNHSGSIFCHREVDLVKLYIFKEICMDLIQRDMKIIRNEMIYKSIILYNVLEKSNNFDLMIDEKNNRSQNILCARVLGPIRELKNYFLQKDILLDYINNEKFGQIIRIGNFPVHSKEQMIYLADMIESI